MPTPTLLPALAVALLASLPALLPGPAAAGDPAAGAENWRQCRACHMIATPGGETVQRGGRVGPNLWGVIGRPAGSAPGFDYSPELVAAGRAGLVWTEDTLAAYITDPTGFLRAQTGDATVRSPMNFRMTEGAADMAAYLASLGG